MEHVKQAVKKVKELQVFQSGNACHNTFVDWYPNCIESLKRAIADEEDWTTGWYGSKTLVGLIRIGRCGKIYRTEANIIDYLGGKQGQAKNSLEITNKNIEFVMRNIIDMQAKQRCC